MKAGNASLECYGAVEECGIILAGGESTVLCATQSYQYKYQRSWINLSLLLSLGTTYAVILSALFLE